MNNTLADVHPHYTLNLEEDSNYAMVLVHSHDLGFFRTFNGHSTYLANAQDAVEWWKTNKGINAPEGLFYGGDSIDEIIEEERPGSRALNRLLDEAQGRNAPIPEEGEENELFVLVPELLEFLSALEKDRELSRKKVFSSIRSYIRSHTLEQ